MSVPSYNDHYSDDYMGESAGGDDYNNYSAVDKTDYNSSYGYYSSDFSDANDGNRRL